MMARIEAPVLANQVLAAASAIFSWAVEGGNWRRQPMPRLDRNPTKSRERVLSDSEVPKFWTAFDDAGLVAGTALKMILLAGQRPGEVAAHAARAHRRRLVGDAGRAGAGARLAGHQERRRAIACGCRAGAGPAGRAGRRDAGFVFAGSRGRPVRRPRRRHARRSAPSSASSARRRTICDGPTARRSPRSASAATP